MAGGHLRTPPTAWVRSCGQPIVITRLRYTGADNLRDRRAQSDTPLRRLRHYANGPQEIQSCDVPCCVYVCKRHMHACERQQVATSDSATVQSCSMLASTGSAGNRSGSRSENRSGSCSGNHHGPLYDATLLCMSVRPIDRPADRAIDSITSRLYDIRSNSPRRHRRPFYGADKGNNIM